MTKPGKGAENKNGLNKGDQGLRKGEPRKVTTTQGAIYEVMRPEVKGPSYPLLKPEVKETLDKIVYQLDLIKNTVGLLETRITQNENQLSSVMDSIKTDDMNYVSTLLNDCSHCCRELLLPKQRSLSTQSQINMLQFLQEKILGAKTGKSLSQ
jgi:hypothetical protein